MQDLSWSGDVFCLTSTWTAASALAQRVQRALSHKPAQMHHFLQVEKLPHWQATFLELLPCCQERRLRLRSDKICIFHFKHGYGVRKRLWSGLKKKTLGFSSVRFEGKQENIEKVEHLSFTVVHQNIGPTCWEAVLLGNGVLDWASLGDYFGWQLFRASLAGP